jgi:Uma2 family endonuclease
MNAPLRMVTQEQVRLRVEDFLWLAEVGALPDHERTELVDGSIYWVAPQHLPHSRMKSDLYDRIRDALRSERPDLRVLTETTVSMPPHDAPLPDIIVLQHVEGDGMIPLASVRLIVEVAVSTLQDDLGTKLQAYAAHGVPEYWVADVAAGVVHQMWAPADSGYGNTEVVDARGPLTIRTLALTID